MKIFTLVIALLVLSSCNAKEGEMVYYTGNQSGGSPILARVVSNSGPVRIIKLCDGRIIKTDFWAVMPTKDKCPNE